jgi:hypothetical protein
MFVFSTNISIISTPLLVVILIIVYKLEVLGIERMLQLFNFKFVLFETKFRSLTGE